MNHTNQWFEVDFRVSDYRGEQNLIQVSERLAEPATRQRELRAMEAAMHETGILQSLIIALDEEERIDSAAVLR